MTYKPDYRNKPQYKPQATYTAQSEEPNPFDNLSKIAMDKEAEAAILNLCFFDFECYSDLKGAGVNYKWFFPGGNAELIWRIFERLYLPPAMEIAHYNVESALKAEFSQENQLDEMLAYREYFLKLSRLHIPRSQVEMYYNRLLKAYRKRLEFTAMEKWSTAILNPDTTSEVSLAELEDEIASIRRVATPFEVVTASDMVESRKQYYQDRLDGKPGPSKMPYEQESLNIATAGGMRRGELTVWMAEPGCGKTALLQRDCYYQAVYTQDASGTPKEQHTCLYITLEMNRDHWIDRVIHQETGISSIQLENGSFYTWQTQVFNKMDQMAGSKLYLIDDSMATLEVIERSIEYVARKEGGIDIVYVDYAQLINMPEVDKELDRIQRISQRLVALSKRYNCHINAIARSNTQGKLHMGKQLEYDTDNLVELMFEAPKEAGKKTVSPDVTSWPVIAFFHKQRYYEGQRPAELLWNRRWVRYTDPDIILPVPETKRGYGR